MEDDRFDTYFYSTKSAVQLYADDVHYLDTSFANNVLEIESICEHQQITTDEEYDLEFF